MYFISEKDGQIVQIELASAFVIFFSLAHIFPNLLSSSPSFTSHLCITRSSVHMFDFLTRATRFTHTYVIYGNVCRRVTNHTVSIDWYRFYNISIAYCLFVVFGWFYAKNMAVWEQYEYIFSISHTELNDEIENCVC